ncbi:hypothetical protein JIN84_05735 [Luteolibacter yonseiensis]|uniref:Uncharacterized protein n=1 Tax=Luteolibacter yonseiensis TaxID=1144680 RepID=A0A934R282_9BACT|nr:hypothetical protein [Luteolibacter yonseiensis]MBK1815102.1 hypothetical protein [Luteolibacter yonseiensis]
MYQEPDSPYFSADLIGADGKLKRLHKGASPPPPPPTPPPPVRDTNRQVAREGDLARAAAAKRMGYAATIRPQKSLLGGSYDDPGSRKLL